MRSILAGVSLAGLCVAATAVPAGAASASQVDTGVTGSYIVVLSADVIGAAAVSQITRDHSSSQGVTVDLVYGHALRGYAARMSPAAAARIARDPRVASVQPDRVVSTTAQDLPTGVDRTGGDVSPTAKIDGRTTG